MVNERLDSLRSLIKKEGLDGYIIFTSDEHQSEYIDDYYKFREYISGFTGSAGTLLVTAKEAYLWTDGRYFIQAENQLKGSGIELVKQGIKGQPTLKEYILEWQKSTHTIITIGTDYRTINIALFNELSLPSVELVDIDLADVCFQNRPTEKLGAARILDIAYAGQPASDKLEYLRDMLGEKNYDGFIVSDLTDIAWVLNIRGNDIRYNPVVKGYLYISKSQCVFFANECALEDSLLDYLRKIDVEFQTYDTFDSFLSAIRGCRIVLDYSITNAHIYFILNEKNEIVNDKSYIYIPKHIKNQSEAEAIRKAHFYDGLSVIQFIYRIKKLVSEGESITEFQAAKLMDDIRLNNGHCCDLSFDTIAAYGANGAIVHYSPVEDSANLKPSGFLLLDSGGQYEGATTDITRTIALGTLSEKMKRMYTLVLCGMLDLGDVIFAEGYAGNNLDVLARQYLWRDFLDYRHGTGHGIGAGLNCHEGPCSISCSNRHDAVPIKAGVVISDEPGVYIENEFGIRIENQLLCVNRGSSEYGEFLGFEVMTLVPFEMDAIDQGLLNEHQKELINTYNETIYTTYEAYLNEDEKRWLYNLTRKLK